MTILMGASRSGQVVTIVSSRVEVGVLPGVAAAPGCADCADLPDSESSFGRDDYAQGASRAGCDDSEN